MAGLREDQPLGSPGRAQPAEQAGPARPARPELAPAFPLSLARPTRHCPDPELLSSSHDTRSHARPNTYAASPHPWPFPASRDTAGWPVPASTPTLARVSLPHDRRKASLGTLSLSLARDASPTLAPTHAARPTPRLHTSHAPGLLSFSRDPLVVQPLQLLGPWPPAHAAAGLCDPARARQQACPS